MATNNTTFTALTSGTRDNSADKGAVYFLDGNTINGRLNIAAGTKWIAGNYTRVNLQGNPSHSYMKGIIEGEDLTYIMEVESGGRGDFSSDIGGYKVRNMTYIFQGNGDIFNHLESDNNQLTGDIKFIIDMTGGNAYIQTNPKEYADVTINVKTSNIADLLFYCSRLGDNHASLPGFKTVGLSSLTLPADGAGLNKHGRFYDPEYYDSNDNLLPNNLLEMIRSGNGTDSIEYFTFDFTGVHESTHLYVEDSLSTVLYSNLQLTDANCKIYEQNGTTELTYYSAKKVVPIEVRRIGTTASTSRNTISYKLRRVGYLPLEADGLVLNAPKMFNNLQVDPNYNGTPIGNEIDTAQELYDAIHAEVMEEFSLPADLLTVNGNSLVVKNGWTLKVDQGLSTPVVVNSGNSEISIKLGVNGLQKTSNFTILQGTIDASLDGNTNMFYLDTNGKVSIVFENLNPENFTLHNDYQANVLTRVTGQSDWTLNKTIDNGSITIKANPNTDLEYSVRVPGYTWTDTIPFNSGDFGTTIDPNLVTIKDLNNIPLFNKPVDETIVATFTYDAVNNRINQTNTTNTLLEIPFLEAFIGIQRVENSDPLVTQLVNRLEVNAERNGFILAQDSTAVFKLTDNSNANVRLLFNIVTIEGTNSVLQIDRFIPSNNGNYILMTSNVINFSTTFPTEESTASAVRTELATELARIDENISAEKDCNIKKVNGNTITDIEDFKADIANISTVIDDINNLIVADSFNVLSVDNNTNTITCLGSDINNQTDNFYSNHIILVRNPLTNELNKRSIMGSLNILGNITFVLNAPLTFDFSADMIANILVDDVNVNNITNAILGQTDRMTFDQNNRMEVNLDDLQRLFVNDSFTITNISNEVISCEDTDLNVTTDDYYKDFILLVRNPTTNILNKRTIVSSLLTGNTVDFTLDSALDFAFENDIIANIMIKDKITDANITDIKTIVDKIQFTDDNDIKATLDGELNNIEDRLNNLPVS